MWKWGGIGGWELWGGWVTRSFRWNGSLRISVVCISHREARQRGVISMCFFFVDVSVAQWQVQWFKGLLLYILMKYEALSLANQCKTNLTTHTVTRIYTLSRIEFCCFTHWVLSIQQLIAFTAFIFKYILHYKTTPAASPTPSEPHVRFIITLLNSSQEFKTFLCIIHKQFSTFTTLRLHSFIRRAWFRNVSIHHPQR